MNALPRCPNCGRPMVVARPAPGFHKSWDPELRCEDWANCGGTLPLPDELKDKEESDQSRDAKVSAWLAAKDQQD